jgi:hypothetical protein
MHDFAFGQDHHDLFNIEHHDTLGAGHHDSNLTNHGSHSEGLLTSLEGGIVSLNHTLEMFHLGHPADLSTVGHLWDLVHHEHGHDPLSPMHQEHPAQSDHGFGANIPGILGNPVDQLPVWHQQTHDDTCAIVSQEFIIHSLTGHDIPENVLVREAIDHGWYTPGGGTSADNVGKLLELHGIHVDRENKATMTNLIDKLNNGQEVIVGVNAEDIWYHGTSQDPLLHYPGIPGQQANHAVEVIGIDNRDPQHPMVILNDPGAPNGQGEEVPLDVFEAAWSASDHYMVSTTDSVSHSTSGPTLGGYYNADGTLRE